MKTSLWIIIALVSGIVGFLMGYSISAYTGAKRIAEEAAHGAPPAAAAAADAHAQKTDAGGYGAAAPSRSRAATEAGGYGAPVAPAAASTSAKPAPAKPAPAAGY